MSLLKYFSALLVVAPLAGCELWLDVDAPQCDTNKSCVELLGLNYTCGNAGVCVKSSKPEPDAAEPGSQLPARWACITEPPKQIVPDPDKTVRLRMDAVDFSSLRVPPGLNARACNPADVDCNDPIVADVLPGPDGFLEFPLPHGFAGFMMFEAPNIVPSILYNNKPWIETGTTSGPALATSALLDDIAKHSGRPNDDTKGVAILEIRDCNDAAGDGVSFDIVEDEAPFYFDGALPARTLEATTISNVLGAAREPRAVGGFSNLPPTYHSFKVRLAETSDLIAEFTLQVRAGHITYVRVYSGW